MLVALAVSSFYILIDNINFCYKLENNYIHCDCLPSLFKIKPEFHFPYKHTNIIDHTLNQPFTITVFSQKFDEDTHSGLNLS